MPPTESSSDNEPEASKGKEAEATEKALAARQRIDKAVRPVLLKETNQAETDGDKQSAARRLALFEQYLSLAYELRKSAHKSGDKRSLNRRMGQLLAGFSAGGAAIAGTSLAAQATGTAARVIGVGAAVSGVAGGIPAALKLESEYARNRLKARTYKGILRELETYLNVSFPYEPLETAMQRFKAFSRAYQRIEPVDAANEAVRPADLTES